MSKIKIKSLGDLEKGIKQLLRENRYPFSDEDKVLLNQCLSEIQKAKKHQTTDIIVKIIGVISRLFFVSHFDDIF